MKRILVALALLSGVAHAQNYSAQKFRLMPQATTPIGPSTDVFLWSNSTNSNHPTLHLGGADYDLLYTLGGLGVSTTVPSDNYVLHFNAGTSTWVPGQIPSGALPSLGPGAGTQTLSTGETLTFDAQGRVTGISPTTRQIIAGTGLSGGGTLALDRTLSVLYGTTGGTAAAGNDARLPPTPGTAGSFVIDNTSGYTSRKLAYGDVSAIVSNTASSIAAGNDSRFPPTPSTAGNFPVDTGSGYTSRKLAYSDLTAGSLVGAIANTVAAGNDARIPIDCVAQYGMSTGASDNTTALNNCISAVASDSAHRYAYISKGTFAFTGTIAMGSVVRLSGSGMGNTVLNFTGSGALTSLMSLNGAGSSSVDHMTLEYTNAAFTGTLVATGAVNTYEFDNVNFTGGALRSAAKLIDVSSSVNGRFKDCYIQGAAVGIDGSAAFNNRILVDNCTFQNNATAAIQNPGLNWTLLSDTFEPDTATGKASGIITTSAPFAARSLHVIGCYFSDASVSGNNWIDMWIEGGAVFSGNLIVNGNGFSSFPQTQVSSVIFESGSRGVAFIGNHVVGGEDIVNNSTCPVADSGTWTNAGSGTEMVFWGNDLQKLSDGSAAAPPVSCTGSTIQAFLANIANANISALNVTRSFSPTGSMTTLGAFAIKAMLLMGQTTVSDANTTTAVGSTTFDYTAITAPRTITETLAQGGNSSNPRYVFVFDTSGNASLTNPIKWTGDSGNNNGSAAAMNLVTSPYGANFAICDGTNCFSPQWISMNDARIAPAPSGAGKILYDTGSAYAALGAGTSSQFLIGGSTPGWHTLVAGDIPNIAESQVTGLTTDLAAKAADSLVVHLAGSEIITGAKTHQAGTLLLDNAGNTFATTLATNASTARTITFPDATDTVAVLGTAQTFSALQTFTASIAGSSANAKITLGNSSNTYEANQSQGAGNVAHVFNDANSLATAGTSLMSLNDSSATGRLYVGQISGTSGVFGYGESLTCSTTCTANEVVVWSGSKQVNNAAASANLTTIAGVAVTSGTTGAIQVARMGRVLVNCDAGVTAGALVGTSSATAGNVAASSPGAGAIVGRSTEATGGTIAGKCIVDLTLD